MRIIRNILLVILALMLQTSWIPKMTILGVAPDLIVMVIVYIGVTGGQIEGTALGFLAGFFQDISMPVRLGSNALANSIVGFGAGYGKAGLVAEGLLVRSAMLFVAVLARDLLYFLCNAGWNLQEMVFLFFRYSPGTAVYTALVGVFLSAIPMILGERGARSNVGGILSE